MSIALRGSTIWTDLKTQWQASARLRLGGWLVLMILALYGMQLGLDQVERQREQLKGLDVELSRLRALSKERAWPDRAKEASQLNAALASMAWAEADLGLTEAAFQDWLRTVPTKLGLKTRELTISRVEEGKPSTAAKVPGGGSGVQGLTPPPDHVVLRARVSFELQRAPLIAFLSECARSERSVVVERLSLRSLSQPQVAELDLRVLARRSEAKR